MSEPTGTVLREPLAYFLTWPTYGTWLPGDERGWVEYRRGFQLPDAARKRAATARMAEEACLLNGDERKLVEATIAQHCRIRNWALHAVNCRSNHVHVVVTASMHPDVVRDQLKAWCSRRLAEHQQQMNSTASQHNPAVRQRWWAQRGSKRYINDADSLEAAILYVRDVQDAPH